VCRTEESADRRLIDRLRDKASHLGTQLGALQVADAAAAKVRYTTALFETYLSKTGTCSFASIAISLPP